MTDREEARHPHADERYLEAETNYTRERAEYWDEFAATIDRWDRPRRAYRERLSEIYRLLVPSGKRVLDLGCATGDLLASLQPSYGVGVDFSRRMLDVAQTRHPGLHFVQRDVHELELNERFDYIVCSDVVHELWDIQGAFERARRHSHPGTRLLLNAGSRVWEIPRRAAETMGLAKRQLPQNWVTAEDLRNILFLSGFETIRKAPEVLWPFWTPLWDGLCNRYLVKTIPLRWLAMTNFVVARPLPEPRSEAVPVSVIVPARNESGNIGQILDRVPEMGAGTELIFVEGNSTDGTYEAIRSEIARRPGCQAKLFRQTGRGKGDAVRLGFANATGELLMILDADLTVPPEDLPRFYEAWHSGKGELINGVRLVYPMQDRAMRFFNYLGNKFFSVAFSWLLGQSIKDTLCGTKVLSRADYETIAAHRAYFGRLDPFGDFDLIFGAAKYSLRILDLPIRYRERTYGETNIRRWSHGWLLLKMLFLAMRRVRFV
jgi:ubiquinone/menaquinone biosynthesis C-methylase UbiE